LLILTRYVGERLLIGDEITVSIEQIHGLHQVRIGVAAPREIAVHQQEVFERIQVERRERAVRALPTCNFGSRAPPTPP
jgi:carbon storage regulator